MDARIDREPVVGLPGAEASREGEGRELHRIGVRVEEVADRRHLLVAEDAVEVAAAKREVAEGEVGIELRHRQAIVLGEPPGRHVLDAELLKQEGVEAARRRERIVGAEQQVDAAAPVPARRPVGDAFRHEIQLVDLTLPGPVGERHGPVEGRSPVVGPDSRLEPAIGEDPSVLERREVKAAKRPRVVAGLLPGQASGRRGHVGLRGRLGSGAPRLRGQPACCQHHPDRDRVHAHRMASRRGPRTAAYPAAALIRS